MNVFLDENFPLALVHRLRDDGHHVDHVITLGWRGASDARIAERLVDADLLFLTEDEDFLFTRALTHSLCFRVLSRRGCYASASISGAVRFEGSSRLHARSGDSNCWTTAL